MRPLAVVRPLRVVTALLLSVLCLATVGGAIVIALLWQQDRASGVLASQSERAWDIFDTLRRIERLVAVAALPVASGWFALAAANVRRATGIRRNPILAAASVPVGALGAWYVGREIVTGATGPIEQAVGLALQAGLLAIPLVTLLHLAQTCEARNLAIRAAYVVSITFVAAVQFLGGLSTVDQASSPGEWSRLSGVLIIVALIQVVGILTAGEAMRAIEEGSEHRYELRNRFGESLLSQHQQPRWEVP